MRECPHFDRPTGYYANSKSNLKRTSTAYAARLSLKDAVAYLGQKSSWIKSLNLGFEVLPTFSAPKTIISM